MPGGAPLLIGSHGRDVPDLPESRGETLDALREDPVVVRDENARSGHGAAASARGITNMRMMYAKIPGKAADTIETIT